MTRIKSKLRTLAVGAGLVLAFALALPTGASAADETLEATFSLEPQSGQLLNNGLKPANWKIDTNVTATGPQILPSKNVDLQFPAGELTFNPGNMPVCTDDKVGPPPTDLSQPVPNIVDRCPDSVIGNGTAKFALAQINSGGTLLDGVIVVFNGGLQGGRPLIKVYAYSYDTNVAVFTEAALQADGSLDFEVPQLTADSSVTSLNLAIPSEQITLTNWGPGAETVVLPKGKKANYAQAQCSSGSWPWSADFTFGTRDTNGDPTGPDSFSSDGGIRQLHRRDRQGQDQQGPGQGPEEGQAQQEVDLQGQDQEHRCGRRQGRQGSRSPARASRVNANGRQHRRPARAKTVKVKAKFSKKGKIKTTVKVTSKNAGKQERQDDHQGARDPPPVITGA